MVLVANGRRPQGGEGSLLSPLDPLYNTRPTLTIYAFARPAASRTLLSCCCIVRVSYPPVVLLAANPTQGGGGFLLRGLHHGGACGRERPSSLHMACVCRCQGVFVCVSCLQRALETLQAHRLSILPFPLRRRPHSICTTQGDIDVLMSMLSDACLLMVMGLMLLPS